MDVSTAEPAIVKKSTPPICAYCVYVGHGDYGYYCISIEGCAMD